MKILNYGSLNYDHIYLVDHIVRPGETLSSSEISVRAGGKGLNLSIALAKRSRRISDISLICLRPKRSWI